MTDPYKLLGIPHSATDAEIRAAYRRQVQLHHPDHNGGSPESTRRFEEVQEAYALIRKLQQDTGTARGGRPPRRPLTRERRPPPRPRHRRRAPDPTIPASTPGWRSSTESSNASAKPSSRRNATLSGSARTHCDRRGRPPAPMVARPTRSSATSPPMTASRRSSTTPRRSGASGSPRRGSQQRPSPPQSPSQTHAAGAGDRAPRRPVRRMGRPAARRKAPREGLTPAVERGNEVEGNAHIRGTTLQPASGTVTVDASPAG